MNKSIFMFLFLSNNNVKHKMLIIGITGEREDHSSFSSVKENNFCFYNPYLLLRDAKEESSPFLMICLRD